MRKQSKYNAVNMLFASRIHDDIKVVLSYLSKYLSEVSIYMENDGSWRTIEAANSIF